MLQIPQHVIEMLSAKGKGYVEAAMKIAEGHKLVEEGTLEMAALDGKQINAGGADVLATVRDLARPKVIDESVRAVLRGGDKTTRELAKGSSRITKRPTVLNKTPTPAATDNRMFGAQAPRCKMALEAIQNDAWLTTSRVAKEVLGKYATAVKVCALLEKAGMIKLVEKANNPRHTGPMACRAFEYWEADPKARIDVVNMHVAGVPVKDPVVLYPAIEAAIKAAQGWASKRVLRGTTGLSPGPLNRVLKAMKKDGLIRTVWKKHNPAHKQPSFGRNALYWEMVGGA